MDRRQFLGTGIAGLSALAMQGPAGASGRKVLAMNRRWLYTPHFVPEDLKPGFDESGMTRVTLPHSNVLLPWHSFEERSYQFLSAYLRHFRLPP